MKRCLSCEHLFSSSGTTCPSCGSGPALKDGFPSYAPDFAECDIGYDPDYFPELASLEEKNFWFLFRNQLIFWALNKYCPNFQSLLEVGCGTGCVLSGVWRHFPNARLLGSEIFTAGLGFAAARLPSAHFIQMDARSIPYCEEFDVVGAFDVLEHIDSDLTVLREVHAALKSNGFLILTVPQHTWLWSRSDEYAHHIRRYSASEIESKVKAAGFDVVRSTSFISTLLPAMLVSRMKRNCKKEFNPMFELRISPWLNAFLAWVLKSELLAIKMGIDFSVGGSRLIVARK